MFVTANSVIDDGAIATLGDDGQFKGSGVVGQTMGQVRFDPGLMRPMLNSRGQPYCTVNTGRTKVNNQTGLPEPVYKAVLVKDLQERGINSPVFNAASLPKDAWLYLDRAIMDAVRLELKAWNDLAASSRVGGFNAMATLTYEYQSMNDPGEALKDMDGLSPARTDRPLFDLKSLPLPITHADFWFSEREIAVSRNTGRPLDTTMAKVMARRIAELVEKTVIGVEAGLAYGPTSVSDTRYTGTSKIYGYTNFPYRVTKTDLNTPTGTNPDAVMTDVLEMVQTMQDNGFNGPWILYHSTAYSRYLNDDYFRSGSTSAVRSVRERIMEIEGIQDIRRLNYLTSGYQMILVQMTPEVAQAIDGMGITTIQWDSRGGFQKNFKIMAIQEPLLRAPYNGVTGIIHGTTS
jgi:hypothetical protein